MITDIRNHHYALYLSFIMAISNRTFFSRSQTLDCGPMFTPASTPMLRNRLMKREIEIGIVSEKGTGIGTGTVRETGRAKTKGHVLKTLPLKRKTRKWQNPELQPQRSIEELAKIHEHICSFPHLCRSTSHICLTCMDTTIAKVMNPAIRDTGGCLLS